MLSFYFKAPGMSRNLNKLHSNPYRQGGGYHQNPQEMYHVDKSSAMNRSRQVYNMQHMGTDRSVQPPSSYHLHPRKFFVFISYQY